MITPARLRGLPRGRRIPQAWGRAAARIATAARPGAQPVMRSEPRSESTAPRGLPSLSGRPAHLAGLARPVAQDRRPQRGLAPPPPTRAPMVVEPGAEASSPGNTALAAVGAHERRTTSGPAVGGSSAPGAGRLAVADGIAARASGVSVPRQPETRVRAVSAPTEAAAAGLALPVDRLGGPRPLVVQEPRRPATAAQAHFAARPLPLVALPEARRAPSSWRDAELTGGEQESGRPDAATGSLDRTAEEVQSRVLPVVLAAVLRRVDARLCDVLG